MKNQWAGLIGIAGESEPLFEVSWKEYLTTRKLLQMGMWCCGACGSLMPAEAQRCKECDTEKFIVVNDKPERVKTRNEDTGTTPRTLRSKNGESLRSVREAADKEAIPIHRMEEHEPRRKKRG